MVQKENNPFAQQIRDDEFFMSLRQFFCTSVFRMQKSLREFNSST